MVQRIQALDFIGKIQEHVTLPCHLVSNPRLVAFSCLPHMVVKGSRAGPPCIFAVVVRFIGNAVALLDPVDLFGKIVELLEDAPRSRLVCGVIGLDDIRLRGKFRGWICMFLVTALNMRFTTFGSILVNPVYGGSLVLSLEGEDELGGTVEGSRFANLHLRLDVSSHLSMRRCISRYEYFGVGLHGNQVVKHGLQLGWYQCR